MKKLYGLFLGTGLLMNLAAANAAQWINDDGTTTKGKFVEMPTITFNEEIIDSNYEFKKNVAQYKMADWSQLIGRVKNVTVEQAKKIADANPEITFFFYVKGGRMILENNDANPPYARVFHHGDAVFFSGTPWWGSAPGLADGYIKKNVN